MSKKRAVSSSAASAAQCSCKAIRAHVRSGETSELDASARLPYDPALAVRPKTPHQVLVSQAASFLRNLLLSRKFYWHFTALLLVGQLCIGLLAIRYVRYTEIDWTAYMEQVEMFKGGERDYSKIRGGTGPLVYPALHLYIYTFLHDNLPTDPTRAIRAAQYFFLGVWLLNFIQSSIILYMAGSRMTRRLPQALLVMLVLSKRNLSIHLLRLFNDPLAMVLSYAAVIAFMGAHRSGRASLWRVGSLFFSLALGVKMNILLFVPGLLVILVQLRGVVGTIESVSIVILTQVLIPATYFYHSREQALAYYTSAFDFSRQFLYVWTVNWRFVSEKVFLSKTFGSTLLAAHLTALLAFALVKWSPARFGGSLGVLKMAVFGDQGVRKAPLAGRDLPSHHIPLVLFTSNLIGVACARSLHYQFYSWYFHQLPLIMGVAFACKNEWAMLLVSGVQFACIEFAWNQYPSTRISSLVLAMSHLTLLSSLWMVPEESRAVREKHIE